MRIGNSASESVRGGYVLEQAQKMRLSSSGAPKIPDNYRCEPPNLVIEQYFLGNTSAWGVFEDRFGTARRQFFVDINGTWSGGTLTLDERFHYYDGEKETRIWKIQKIDACTYTGTANGVVGQAVGEQRGNALRWKYDFDLKVGGRTVRVHFDDRMYLQSDGVMLNHAKVSKFGIEMGTVTLAFRK